MVCQSSYMLINQAFRILGKNKSVKKLDTTVQFFDTFNPCLAMICGICRLLKLKII